MRLLLDFATYYRCVPPSVDTAAAPKASPQRMASQSRSTLDPNSSEQSNAVMRFAVAVHERLDTSDVGGA
jgi:hypothetical protein